MKKLIVWIKRSRRMRKRGTLNDRRCPSIPDLLPCPFCYGDPVLKKELRNGYDLKPADPDAYAFYYFCTSCACHGGWSKSPRGAVKWWNMRVDKSAYYLLQQIDEIDK